MTPEQYRGLMETLNLRGSKKENDKRFKEIARRLGNMKFKLSDLHTENELAPLLTLLDDGTMTLDDFTILAQYDKAIYNRDTKSAEFIRDTRGEKPSTNIDVTQETSALSQLSKEQLIALADLLKQEVKDGD